MLRNVHFIAWNKNERYTSKKQVIIMGNTERQLRQTIEDQDKEICLLKDQLNRLTEINNNLWNLFIEQSKQIKMLNNLNPISNELERNERNKK